MESQLEKLIIDLAVAVRKLSPTAQSINVTLDIVENNRLNWSANIQETDEDQVSYSRSRSLPR
jgi:hypothetical protein